MAGKTRSKERTGSTAPVPRKPATAAGPRKRSARPPAAPLPEPADTPRSANGARALIRAGLEALGNVRGDMAARQTRIFELLLGIGQSPGWSTPSKPDQAPEDPFGKFEDVFDQRVARSLERLGMPSPAQLRDLSERVDALTALLNGAPSKPRRR